MTRATALRAVSFFCLIFGFVHYAYKNVCRKHMIIQFCNTVILKYYFFCMRRTYIIKAYINLVRTKSKIM